VANTQVPPSAKGNGLEKALEGVRVLDLSNEFGMYCGRLLADLGADVIKVEPPGGDSERNLPPFYQNHPNPDRSLTYWYFNASKRSITLNLDNFDGRQIFRRLALNCDIILETFKPGTLEKWGLGIHTLQNLNPSLVLVSTSGFRQTGPHRNYETSDIVAYAMSGTMYCSGDPGQPPVKGPASPSRYIPAAHAAEGALLALLARAGTGRGQHVDISLQESLSSLITEFGVARYLNTGFVLRRWCGYDRPQFGMPQGTYRCQDGWVCCYVARPEHWIAFAIWINEVTGNMAILDERFEAPAPERAQYTHVIRPIVEDFFMRWTKEEVYREAQLRHITISPMRTVGDLPQDPQLKDRGYWTSVEHEELEDTIVYPGRPYTLAETPWQVQRRPPMIGEHNHDVYCGELGLSPQELNSLSQVGAI